MRLGGWLPDGSAVGSLYSKGSIAGGHQGEYIERMEDALALYEKQLSKKRTAGSCRREGGGAASQDLSAAPHASGSNSATQLGVQKRGCDRCVLRRVAESRASLHRDNSKPLLTAVRAAGSDCGRNQQQKDSRTSLMIALSDFRLCCARVARTRCNYGEIRMLRDSLNGLSGVFPSASRKATYSSTT